MRVVAQNIEQSTGLIPIEQVNGLALFTENGLEPLLKEIEAVAMATPQDVSTDAGRQLIASTAYKVARSKTTIDDAGKDLVSEWKKQSAVVDAARKRARDFLDDLKVRVRHPLTDWEMQQARIELEKRQAAEAEAARIKAEEEAALRERERVVAEKEAAIAKAEAERQEQERLKQQEADRKDREEQIRQEAEAKAKRDAGAALKAAQEATERAEQAARDAEARAKRQAEEAAEQARLKAVREQAEREAAQKAADEQKRREDETRAANKANRDRLNKAIVAVFTREGVDAQIAAKVVELVASGRVPHMTIRY